ncbi:hypothetical protein [Streptomyces fumanus]|uniref:Uncharacterized protein n=1 Tax=Streptomyces fumanus TaxID=67302 RepID=A0A919DVC1_9ACTN|nr:hypothetical protein [Streptomyces fumanus]GHE84776.1 hypothetical protein GCM10018772_04820 [Streptomyces fumanus]
MSLATITAASLPPQVYSHAPEHNVELTADPTHWRPVQGIGTGWVKPRGGTGLWTSPVIAWTEDGTPADSAWLGWCRAETGADTSGQMLTEILPISNARLLLIDAQDHLTAIVATYPAEPNRFLPHRHGRYPDWEALAADSWDGVYLTDRGQWATRMPRSGPDLYGWDLESMLWLRPAYMVGRTVLSAAADSAGVA